jgi:hypothetical protein
MVLRDGGGWVLAVLAENMLLRFVEWIIVY